MGTPDLKLTMLGAADSGKTTFMLGMYNTLAVGMHNYFIFTEDPDQDVELREIWENLLDNGVLPQATRVNENKYYRFVFNHGFTPLLSIDWMDYRGGAVGARSTEAQDVAVLHKRLAESDSIYLVLDGQKLAPWLNGEKALTAVQQNMGLGRVSALVNQAVHDRTGRGLPVPSLVVIITKADLLRGPGRTLRAALDRVVDDALEQLVPITFNQDVSALVCPVKVGNFGVRTSADMSVRVSDVDPVGLHRPMIFSLMHYLTEGQGAWEIKQADYSSSRSAAQQQLAALNQGFMSIFRGQRITDARNRMGSLDDALERGKQEYAANQSLIERLAQELAGHPMIRNGKVER
jgi:hypothetical protein